MKTINLAPRWMGLARPFIQGYLNLQKDCEHCIGNESESKFVASLLEDACTQMDKRNDQIKEEFDEDMLLSRKNTKTLNFMLSPRGQIVMAKAIHYGLEIMNKVEKPLREISDIADIEKIRDNVFPNLILENDLKILAPEVITKVEKQQKEKGK
tara:strand:- start:9450 stop:9911 length:462 start_codon:yes stop_codon:yes gene_type:complete